MFYNKKKQFFVLVSILILVFTCFSFASALEVEYPEMGGKKIASSTDFPQYVVYIFNFSIIISGIIALGVMVFAGISILTSPDQPSTIQDAKTKIIGAFLGIVILLSSYLILTTINPKLVMLGSLEKLKPITGIYLIINKDSKSYITDSVPNLSSGGATLMEFLSTKNELKEIYVYSDKDYKGTETKIVNPKTSPSMVAQSGFPSNAKSIYFVWNRPGIYLYPGVNYVGRPRYFNRSVSSLTSYDFNDSASSLRFINSSSTGAAKGYSVLLFTEDAYKGECDWRPADSANLSIQIAGPRYQPIGTKKLSSFYLLKTLHGPGSEPISGNVTFYDQIDCQGDKYIQPVTEAGYYVPAIGNWQKFDGSVSGRQDPVDGNILSFEINGNYAVVLNTEQEFKGRCQLFIKPSERNCIRTLKGEYVYGDAVGEDGDVIRLYRVHSYSINPLAE